MLEQYRISDFIEWNREKKLDLNPEFQRGSVWPPTAKIYLIDTILRNLPVPKIYLRTKIDAKRQTSIREVVDGQQRLKAILDFAADKFRLTKRTGEFEKLTYSTLSLDQKAVFLEYPLAVEQLLNASENDVLEVFARLNSYNITLNPAERRHAKYQGAFKWCVRDMSRNWSNLWTKYGIMSTRERVRMEDNVTMAQMLMIATEGVQDGGSNKIDKFYNSKDSEYPESEKAIQIVNDVLEVFTVKFGETVKGTALAKRSQFLILFAALAHRLHGIPQGGIESPFPPARQGIDDQKTAQANLETLAAALEADDPPETYVPFIKRSASSTQRITSRQVRFRFFHEALGDKSF